MPAADERAVPEPGGLYFHIPFCQKKCGYCDFFSVTDRAFIPQFVDSLIAEMALKSDTAIPYDTLNIGGGTPSVLSAEQIESIVAAAHHHFDIDSNAEITIEVNPGTIEMQHFKTYRNAGINRLNIGVQSFSDRHLNFLGRIHTAREARLAIESAKKTGFEQIGVDLIYGIPEQSRESWLADLQQAVDLNPDHLSCYMLTIEPGTPMERDRTEARFETLGEEQVAELFKTAQSFLDHRGYLQYEISNFASSETAKARHNGKYWILSSYDGLGPSAHSFRTPVRWWNHRSVPKYNEEIRRGKVPVAGKEVLGTEQQIIERIYLGLRTADGIDIPVLNRYLKSDFRKQFSEVLAALDSEGMLILKPESCCLTPKGMRYHEGIAKMFIEYV